MRRWPLLLLLLAAGGVAGWLLRGAPDAVSDAGSTQEEGTLTRTTVAGGGAAAAPTPAVDPLRAEALAHNDAALAMLDAGRAEEAVALFEQALELAPDDAVLARNLSRARLRVGVAAFREGRLEDAQRWFDAAHQADPDEGASRWWTARLLMQQGRRDAAAAVLDAALDAHPQAGSLWQLRGELWWLAGDLFRAVEALRKAVALLPDDRELAARLAQLEEEQRAYASFLTDSTAHFDVRYDPADRALVEALPGLREDLDAIFVELVAALGLQPEQRLLVLFLDPDRFGHEAPGWSAGLYDGRIRLLVEDPDRQRAQLRATMRHELTHALLHGLGPQLPTWLHEGLAQRAEGRDPRTARRALRASGLTLDAALLADDWTAWSDAAQVREAYAYALSLCDWLPRRFGEGVLRNLLQTVPGRGFDAAWQLAVGRPWAEVEVEHRAFLLEGEEEG